MHAKSARSMLLCAAVLVASCVLLCSRVFADDRLVGLGINYAVAGPVTPGLLLNIDTDTGMSIPFGPTYLIEIDRIGDNLAVSSQGRMFNFFGANVNLSISQLNELDPITGHILRSVPLSDSTGFPPVVMGAAFDSQDQLFAITLSSSPLLDAAPALSQIDVETGLTTPLVSVDTFDYSSLAFDPDDNLFAVARDQGLLMIDPANGNTQVIGGDLGGGSFPFTSPSITFAADGTLYGTTQELVTVNPATGTTTPVGSTSILPNTIVGLEFVPFPLGDFDADGSLTVGDLDLLVEAVAAGSHALGFDLNGDQLVDIVDLNAWLSVGGATNLPSGNPYLPGDANLDGSVDGDDFLVWNSYRFTSVAAWSRGDFTADGIVDGQDLLRWNAYKFQTADGGQSVPEPAASLFFGACLAVVVGALRGR